MLVLFHNTKIDSLHETMIELIQNLLPELNQDYQVEKLYIIISLPSQPILYAS